MASSTTLAPPPLTTRVAQLVQVHRRALLISLTVAIAAAAGTIYLSSSSSSAPSPESEKDKKKKKDGKKSKKHRKKSPPQTITNSLTSDTGADTQKRTTPNDPTSQSDDVELGGCGH